MSSTTTPINVTAQKATLAALLAALVKGINTELAGVDSIVLDGTTYARTDLLARIQAALDALASVKVARTALAQVVSRQDAAVAQAKPLRAGVKRYLQLKYGPTSPKLQEFGFTPTHAPVTSVKTKAEAKVKAAATRAARGTKGKKQKAQITGATTSQPVADATRVPATAPAAAPTKPAS